MNQTWQLLWFKNSFKMQNLNENACPLGKVKPTASSLWPWNPLTDVAISQNSGNIGGVPTTAQGTTFGIFHASLWYEECSTCICIKQFHKTNLCLPFHSPVAVRTHLKRPLKLGNHLFEWKCSCTKSQLLARISSLCQVWNQKGSWPNKWPSVGGVIAAKGRHLTEETLTL